MAYIINTVSLDHSATKLSYDISPERIGKRVELCGQELALGHLGGALDAGDTALIQARWQSRQVGNLYHLAACEITVTAPDGNVLVCEEVITGEIFLLETQAAITALSSQHYVFRTGERAVTLVYANDAEDLTDMQFSYRMPAYDETIRGDMALLTGCAAGVIGALLESDDGVEKRAFAVGAIGPEGGCVVTDILVPPGQSEASTTSVEFDPSDWAFVTDAVSEMGDPFRVLGPLHTHPGSLTPSVDDWDLFTWTGCASSLYIIASIVGRQPTAAGYRWHRGSLRQADLQVEQAAVAEGV